MNRTTQLDPIQHLRVLGDRKEALLVFRTRSRLSCALGALVALGVSLTMLAAGVAAAEEEHADLGEVAAKLSNPVSDVWALFTELDLSFNNGNVNRGDDKLGGAMIFQPLLPVTLTEGWKIIMRPTIPIQFVQPQPDGFTLL